MKIKLKVILLGAAVAMTMSAFGQGGRMMMMGGNSDPSGIMLLRRDDVARDLKLTTKQKGDLEAMNQAMREQMRDLFQNAGGDREAMQKAMVDLQKKSKAEVEKILEKGQMLRLRQIAIQLGGNSMITSEEIQKELEMTTDQIAKVKDISAKSQEANQAIFQKMRDGEIERDQVQELMTKNRKILNDELGKILTEKQKGKLKEMGGPEFKADPDQIR